MRTTLGPIVVTLVVAACGDGTGVGGGSATVQGSVEQTMPSSSPAAVSGPQSAPSSSGRAASVVHIQSDGDFTELATAEVEADGSFEIQGVPPGRTDLAVVAYVDGRAAGSVMLHGKTRSGQVMVAAPINYETTVETQAYTRIRAEGSAGSANELALLVHMRGAAAEAVATSSAEVEAVADGYVIATSAMTAAYAASGSSFDASARAEALAHAAMQFAIDRHDGLSLEAAHAAFADAALDAYVSAGATLERSVMASAAAASTFDAVLEAQSSERAEVVAQAVRLNLRARERLAAQFSTSSEASLAADIRATLSQARVALGLMAGLVDLHSILEGTAEAATTAVVDGSVELLAGSASTTVRTEVRAKAEAVVEAARLEARLQGAATAQAAAAAVATYRATVRAAVDAMIEASGATSVDAAAITSLYIAACGGAYIR
jgi:hypothetical protein